ncbi:MAG: nitroreductase family deazaflavin-dependent oxidoreductase [Chloroflexota bacterium]
MDDDIRRALSRGHRIDITTTGRRTGRPRRIEIVFHNIGGRVFITGRPSRRTRAWIHNLEADPRLTFHLKGPVKADLPARARIVTEDAERRAIFAEVVKTWTGMDIDTMTEFAPLIEVTFEDVDASAA